MKMELPLIRGFLLLHLHIVGKIGMVIAATCSGVLISEVCRFSERLTKLPVSALKFIESIHPSLAFPRLSCSPSQWPRNTPVSAAAQTHFITIYVREKSSQRD